MSRKYFGLCFKHGKIVDSREEWLKNMGKLSRRTRETKPKLCGHIAAYRFKG